MHCIKADLKSSLINIKGPLKANFNRFFGYSFYVKIKKSKELTYARSTDRIGKSRYTRGT